MLLLAPFLTFAALAVASARSPRVGIVPLPEEYFGWNLGEWCNKGGVRLPSGLATGSFGCMFYHRMRDSPYYEADPDKADYFLVGARN